MNRLQELVNENSRLRREIATANEIKEHLRDHLTDGRWHDACIYCQRRRADGGTGVRPDEL